MRWLLASKKGKWVTINEDERSLDVAMGWYFDSSTKRPGRRAIRYMLLRLRASEQGGGT